MLYAQTKGTYRNSILVTQCMGIADLKNQPCVFPSPLLLPPQYQHSVHPPPPPPLHLPSSPPQPQHQPQHSLQFQDLFNIMPYLIWLVVYLYKFKKYVLTKTHVLTKTNVLTKTKISWQRQKYLDKEKNILTKTNMSWQRQICLDKDKISWHRQNILT